MGRKRESLFEQLITMPLWARVVVAAAVYFGLTFLFPILMSGNRIGSGFAHGLAVGAPYVALLFLLAIPFSLLNAAKRRDLLDAQRDLSTIRALSWSDFELMVGEAFRRQGYAVEERGGSAPDGGVDLVLRRDGQKTVVQCKHWKAQQVSVNVVRELLGVMVAEGAKEGILVSSGRFTSDAKAFAKGKAISLIDGETLTKLIPGAHATAKRNSNDGAEASHTSITCPNCGSEMIRRIARKGANAGTGFWGCTLYPKCNGTRSG